MSISQSIDKAKLMLRTAPCALVRERGFLGIGHSWSDQGGITLFLGSAQCVMEAKGGHKA